MCVHQGGEEEEERRKKAGGVEQQTLPIQSRLIRPSLGRAPCETNLIHPQQRKDSPRPPPPKNLDTMDALKLPQHHHIASVGLYAHSTISRAASKSANTFP
jgi:hypothetical protein